MSMPPRVFMHLVAVCLLLSGCTSAPSRDPGHERPVRIVAFGDSTTAPRRVDDAPLPVYIDQLAAHFGDRAVCINAGVPGNTTRAARDRFDTDVLAQQPDLVIIQFGINDSTWDVWKDPPATGPRISIDAYAENLVYFITALRQHGAAVILMTPNPIAWSARTRELYAKPPYLPDDPAGFNVTLAPYIDRVRAIARDQHVVLVDVAAMYADHAATAGGYDDLLLDGMHPNAQGHTLVTSQLISAVEAELKRAR